MKQYSRLITLAGGVIALFSFALPWDYEDSGVELANDSFDYEYVFFVIVMFLASMFIIFLSLFFYYILILRITKFFVVLSSIIGLICFFVLFFGDRWDLDIEDNSYGVFLCAIGFVIAIVGVWEKPDQNTIIITDDRKN